MSFIYKSIPDEEIRLLSHINYGDDTYLRVQQVYINIRLKDVLETTPR